MSVWERAGAYGIPRDTPLPKIEQLLCFSSICGTGRSDIRIMCCAEVGSVKKRLRIYSICMEQQINDYW